MKRKWNVAILGATGMVGQTLIQLLEQQAFAVNQLFPLASVRSEGGMIDFKGARLSVIDVEKFDFSQADLAFFSAGASASAHYAPIAAEAGCVVIDNTSHFRYESDIPLVIPEVNPETIEMYKVRNIIANPNCSTIQMLVALKPIYDAVGIERIQVVTYQSVSGSGKQAVDELRTQSLAYLKNQAIEPAFYPCQIAYNLIPQIDVFEENGYTKEEMKMVKESQKILNEPNLRINATAVRVPVFVGHSEAIQIETTDKITVSQARELLKSAAAITLKDDRIEGGYPTPLIDAMGNDKVYVGRIRDDLSHPRGLNLWVVADNIRKGAALNSLQIAKILASDYL